MKVPYHPNSTTEAIEGLLLQKAVPLDNPEYIRELAKALEALSTEELEELARDLGFNKLKDYSAPTVLAAIQTSIHTGGFNPYLYAVIGLHWVASLLGLVLPFIVYQTLTYLMRILSGPIGWALTGLWAIWKLLGPAYRVIVPATVVIASLRQIHKHKHKKNA